MSTKTMIWLIGFGIVAAFSLWAWKLTARSSYESAEYTVVLQDGNLEIREYPELTMASTRMTGSTQGNDGSFGRLFQYISGSNQSKQKVAMTTPVFMEPDSEASSGKMSFVMPQEDVGSEYPEPQSSQVWLTKRTAGRFAVIRFAGRLSRVNCDEQQAKLESWMNANGYTSTGEVEFAGYDPPWTPSWFRRNEILIRIQPLE